MDYKEFNSILDNLRQMSDTVDEVHKFGVDLLEFSDPLHRVIKILLREIYIFEGWEWIDWYCYECDFGRKKMGAWDENGNEICYDDKSLWEYVEKLRKK